MTVIIGGANGFRNIEIETGKMKIIYYLYFYLIGSKDMFYLCMYLHDL